MQEQMASQIQSVSPSTGAQTQKSRAVVNDPTVPSFKETLKTFLTDVNSMQNHADSSIEKMVAGEITDVHQVMLAVEEANLAFNLMMEIRTKMVDAYQELMRMQA
jgi:flagellar hook-basal body complex protein FliE